MSIRNFLVAVAVLASLVCNLHAEDRGVELVGVERGKSYKLTIALDGTLTLVPLERLTVNGSPNPPPNPPAETPFQKSVRQLTSAALARGGNPVTAAKIAAIYALVSDDCSASKPGMPGLASPLIVAATDEVLKDATDKAAWTEWRAGLTPLLGAVPGIGSDRLATAAALDDVAVGMRAALDSAAKAEPGILDKIDWTAIRELLRPILQQLLNKLIEELLKKLP